MGRKMNDLSKLGIAYRLFALCLGLCSACAKSKSPEAGTNTNWLQACDTTADCEGEGECLCGVCTLRCTSDAACAPVGKAVECTKASADRCTDGTTGSVCLPAAAGPDAEDGGARGDSSPPDAGLGLTRVGDAVQVPERYRPCGLDQDCVLVDRSCNNCCDYDAIREHDSADFASNHERACSGYRGPVCMCGVSELVSICNAGTCAAVTPEALRLCFSPTQNPQRAGAPDAVGCKCDAVGLEICVEGVSLECAGFAGNLRWRPAEVDVCADAPGVCRESSRRPDPDACLADYSSCYPSPNGGFCGVGCRGALDCAGGDCEYAPLEDSGACTTQFEHAWEGVCGDVRYRIHDLVLQTPEAAATDIVSWYWDVKTGALLAKREPADESTCEDEYIVRGDPQVVNDCLAVLDASTQLCPRQEPVGGGQCGMALDCVEFDCSYDPYTAGCDGNIHVHEGLCGEVRYRNMVGIAGSTWYWNASNGELEAVVIGGDIAGSCTSTLYGNPSIVRNCELVIDATTAICE